MFRIQLWGGNHRVYGLGRWKGTGVGVVNVTEEDYVVLWENVSIVSSKGENKAFLKK